jgi:hypothetical protein
MKTLRYLSWKFCLGLLAGFGLILIFYCLTLPAKPFVYVGF